MDYKLKCMNFRWADDGHRKKPTDVLRCMREHHNMVVSFNICLGPTGSSRMMSLNKYTGTSSPTRCRIGSRTIKTLTPLTQLRPSAWMGFWTTSNVTGNYISRTKRAHNRQITRTSKTRGVETTMIINRPTPSRMTARRPRRTKVIHKDGSVATNNGRESRDGDRGRFPIQGHDELRHN